MLDSLQELETLTSLPVLVLGESLQLPMLDSLQVLETLTSLPMLAPLPTLVLGESLRTHDLHECAP